MEKKILLQRIKKTYSDEYSIGQAYYAVLSVLNDLHLTDRELQLMAFTAIHGTISYASLREEFCKKYNTSNPTINNMISRLKKLGVLVKSSGKIKVNPHILLDFKNNVKLDISLEHGEAS